LGLYFTSENNNKRYKNCLGDHKENNTIDRINLHRN